MRSGEPQATDLREILRPLWTWRWLILGAAVLVTALVVVVSVVTPKDYTATSRLLVQTSQVEQFLFNTSASNPDDRTTKNLSQVVTSGVVATEAGRELRRGEDNDA